MKIAVHASDASWDELIKDNEAPEFIRVKNAEELFNISDTDAFFDLSVEIKKTNTTGKPYFVNSVSSTLKEINAGKKTIRLNGWYGFVEKETWEVSGDIDDEVTEVLLALKKKTIAVADEPGFISARIISMIVNEAYFAEGEQVSSKKDIDIAMKLGTNYPNGPFEWADKIGIHNIYELLQKLSVTDSRYTISPALIKKMKG